MTSRISCAQVELMVGLDDISCIAISCCWKSWFVLRTCRFLSFSTAALMLLCQVCNSIPHQFKREIEWNRNRSITWKINHIHFARIPFASTNLRQS